MSKRSKLLTGAAVAVVVLAGGAYALLALMNRDAPAPVGLGPTSSTSPSGDVHVTEDDLAGDWSVVAGDSFVGYRVREQLASLPAPDEAVGRTTAVQGSLHIAGTRIDAVTVMADLTQLSSDEARRDARIHTDGLESDAFPTATFELTSPISLGSTPAEGEEVDADATGQLTLHGVTNDVTFPVQARWTEGGIEVAGSLDIVFSDYQIQSPSFAGFVSVEDHGTIELQLAFVPA